MIEFDISTEEGFKKFLDRYDIAFWYDYIFRNIGYPPAYYDKIMNANCRMLWCIAMVGEITYE